MSKDAKEPQGMRRGVFDPTFDPTQTNQTEMPDTGYLLAQQQQSYLLLMPCVVFIFEGMCGAGRCFCFAKTCLI